jgi:CubicO group peptidase (beta-lactamase class C family)
VFAVLFAVVGTVVGAGALYFVSTMAVHPDPAAVPSTPGVHAERYAGAIVEARRLALALVLQGNLPGLSVAVARDGAIVWTEGFGWADVEDRRPVTPETQFRLGSVSKTLTAAALALLHERGRLDLDAPVQTYVPAYPQKAWTVTTRQLMGDIAGVHRIRGDNNDNVPHGQCMNLGDAVATFADEPLLFEPGTRYRFATNGWILVSAVAEAAAGEPLHTFMRREILEPLRMGATVVEGGDVPDTTSFYIPRANMRTKLGVREVSRLDTSCLAGAGAFFSTPSDLARFGSAMLKPGLLKPETIALLQTPLRLKSGASTDFALGWKIERVQLADAPARMVAHRATPNGGTVALLTFPDHDLVVALATNISPAEGVSSTGQGIAETFIEWSTSKSHITEWYPSHVRVRHLPPPAGAGDGTLGITTGRTQSSVHPR